MLHDGIDHVRMLQAGQTGAGNLLGQGNQAVDGRIHGGAIPIGEKRLLQEQRNDARSRERLESMVSLSVTDAKQPGQRGRGIGGERARADPGSSEHSH